MMKTKAELEEIAKKTHEKICTFLKEGNLAFYNENVRGIIFRALTSVQDEALNGFRREKLEAIAKSVPCRGKPYERCGDTEAGFYQCDVHWGAYQAMAALQKDTE